MYQQLFKDAARIFGGSSDSENRMITRKEFSSESFSSNSLWYECMFLLCICVEIVIWAMIQCMRCLTKWVDKRFKKYDNKDDDDKPKLLLALHTQKLNLIHAATQRNR